MCSSLHPAKQDGNSVARTSRPNSGNKRILLIDGHAVFRECLAFKLERRAGCESIHAESLAKAAQILGELRNELDLLIVGVNLPDEDGTGLIENLREAEAAVPVLVLTSSRSRGRRARALRAGADEVLSAASSAEKILEVVRRLVGG
jgi:DNA-binding NarL/FixJ family response regulator